MGTIHARRAVALVGTPFRAQGRNPDHGLDCVGLCLSAFELPTWLTRSDYRLRGDYRDELEAVLRTEFRKVRPSQARPGDLMLLQPATDQFHLGILTTRGFVHADARLRRIVETPGLPSWPLIGTYRPRKRVRD